MIYLDTGCLVKLYYPEPESAKVAGLIQVRPIWYTAFHDLEFTNALSLKLFFKTASLTQMTAARNLIVKDLADGVLV